MIGAVLTRTSLAVVVLPSRAQRRGLVALEVTPNRHNPRVMDHVVYKTDHPMWRTIDDIPAAIRSFTGYEGWLGDVPSAIIAEDAKPETLAYIKERIEWWAARPPIPLEWRDVIADRQPADMPGWPLRHRDHVSSDLVAMAYFAALEAESRGRHVHVEGGRIQARACGTPMNVGRVVPFGMGEHVTCPACVALLASAGAR